MYGMCTVAINNYGDSMTPKQKSFLDFIEAETLKHGSAPTQREIAEHFGFRSMGTVQTYIKTLEEQGHLKKSHQKARAIRLTNKSECIELPLLGDVAAGLPIEAIEGYQNFSVPISFMKPGREYFCLKVQGDSMIDEHICNGDVVLIKRQNTCDNGDIIVGVVDGAATLKRYKKSKKHIELLPANQKYKPIIVHPDQDFRVAGIFSGLFRF
jgi:repressor LexA